MKGARGVQAKQHSFTMTAPFMVRARAIAYRSRAAQLARPQCLHRRLHGHGERAAQERRNHRQLGTQQELFITTKYSPGSPIFLPRGTCVFNRLVDFLRSQYVHYGFQEVITPIMYKKSLWKKSGHLANFANDMYSIAKNAKPNDSCCDEQHTIAEDDDEQYAIKPMNCPGHCLIFKSKPHSYRDLPVRYADFSPLHRNEISGALTGLTRVRRFHQDDGHIFCRPCQVEEEIKKTLDFVKLVYSTLNLGTNYRLLLSTRPKENYIGTIEEWERAENSLRRALDDSEMQWSVNSGDGAFYGPKIDIVLQDQDGKEHQTATIQLDFQMPKLFELEYVAPAPELEARGEETDDAHLLVRDGFVQPVMIHRAVLGSVERLMAILLESNQGKWPFWLNPRQVIILTVNTTQPVVDWAQKVRDTLVGFDAETETANGTRGVVRQTGLAVDLDATPRLLGAKIRDAHNRGYGEIIVLGEKDVENGQITMSRAKERMHPQAARDLLVARAARFE